MGDMLFVGCKLPNGLHLDVIGEDGQTRTRVGTLGGCAQYRGEKAPLAIPLTHGYRMTQIDADGFKAWMDQNKGSPLLKDRVVIYGATEPAFLSMAKSTTDHVKEVSAPVKPADYGLEVADRTRAA